MPVADLVHGWREMDAALPGYEAAEDAAAGRVQEIFPDPVLEAKLAPLADRYRFPLAAIPIEVLASRVELLGVVSGVSELDDAIDLIVQANQLQVQFPDLIEMTFKYGDGYLMAWPVEQDTPPAAGVASQLLAAAGVEVTVQNPKHCRVFYDEESEREPLMAIKRWEVRVPLGQAWRADVYYPGRVERYVTRVGEDPKVEASWLPFRDVKDDEDDPAAGDGSQLKTPTPDELPFIHFRTALPYGQPVHSKVYGCQSAITKMLVTQLDSTDSHGWPQRYRLLTLGAELDQATDNVPWGDDADSDDTRHTDGSVSSAQPSGPGTVQTFTGTTEVGQFDAANPQVFLDPVELYLRLMAQLSFTPFHYFDPSGEVPSGESLKVSDVPLKKRADRMIVMLTGPTQAFWDYALRVSNRRPAGLVDVKWAPTVLAVGSSAWEEVTAKQQAYVPVADTLIEAGYPREVVEGWDLPQHPADLVAADTTAAAGGVPVGPPMGM